MRDSTIYKLGIVWCVLVLLIAGGLAFLSTTEQQAPFDAEVTIQRVTNTLCVDCDVNSADDQLKQRLLVENLDEPAFATEIDSLGIEADNVRHVEKESRAIVLDY